MSRGVGNSPFKGESNPAPQDGLEGDAANVSWKNSLDEGCEDIINLTEETSL